MNRGQFHRHRQHFVRAFRSVLSERGKNAELTESGVCAYADYNPLIRFLFWHRIWVATNFLQARGPYEAVLDFGCGSGVVVPLLATFANRVVGLDANLGPYRALCAHIPFPEAVEVYGTQDHPLSSFSDSTFDAIVALDVLEHVDDLEDVLAQICRITKPGGLVVFSGPTENMFYRIGRKIAGKQYTGDYHVTNIHDIRRTASAYMSVRTVATLYYPFPLFKVFAGYPERQPIKKPRCCLASRVQEDSK